MSSLALEGYELQQELIRELEAKVTVLEQELKMYKTWEDTREVTEFIDRIRVLMAQRNAMAQCLANHNIDSPILTADMVGSVVVCSKVE